MKPSIISFWDTNGNPIQKRQADALKWLLYKVGAVKVRCSSKNKCMTATFASWDEMEKANKDILTPLQILFGHKQGIDSTFGRVPGLWDIK
jgi:hypothetical protein